MNLEVKHPEIFGDSVRAVFTLKNPDLNSEESIPGLNLGLNKAPRSLVEVNRDKILTEFGFGIGTLAFAHQVHGDSVLEVDQPGEQGKGDALITMRKGVTLGIKVADCGSLLMADEQAGVIAAVHAGWRSAAAEIHIKALRRMAELGASPAAIRVFMGPCISLETFEVGEEVAVQFPDKFIERSYKKPHIDLQAFLKEGLIEVGVEEENIEIDRRCTILNEDNFYSYRREGDQSGRMMALIQMRKDN